MAAAALAGRDDPELAVRPVDTAVDHRGVVVFSGPHPVGHSEDGDDDGEGNDGATTHVAS
jgi:hypothetical protein